MTQELIGQIFLDGNELENWASSGEKKRIKDKTCAKLKNFKKSIDYTFFNFICHGLMINCMTSIDFTGSNGDPKSQNSLHFVDHSGSNRFNQYESAIWSVNSILEDYDSDKLFPVYGFGAKVPNLGVSHMFPCNLNPQNPFVHGTAGVLQTYRDCIRAVQLYGPTNFAPTIREASRMAAEADKRQK